MSGEQIDPGEYKVIWHRWYGESAKFTIGPVPRSLRIGSYIAVPSLIAVCVALYWKKKEIDSLFILFSA